MPRNATLSEIADLVFGAHTADTPLPLTLMGAPLSWDRLFPTPKPAWYVDPMSERLD